MHLLKFFSSLLLAFATIKSPFSIDGSKLKDVGLADNVGSPLQIPMTHVSNPSISCTNPIVRKEWRSITSLERKSWVNAIKCLASLPSDNRLIRTGNLERSNLPPYNKSSSAYDDFCFLHEDHNDRAHQTGLFFPWHRYLLWSFERTLRQRCNYTGISPYWDWTRDAGHFGTASIFDSDPESGFGGFGNEEENYVVYDGAFAHFQLAYPSPHQLRRRYTPSPYLNLSTPLFPNRTLQSETTFTREEVRKVVSGFRGDFKGMQGYVEDIGKGMHMAVHMTTGGDLGGNCPSGQPPSQCETNTTPNDPLFWPHHAMMDKIWWDWQNAHSESTFAFEGGTVRDLDTWPQYRTGRPPAVQMNYTFVTDGILFGNYTVDDVMNTTSGAPLCYIYE